MTGIETRDRVVEICLGLVGTSSINHPKVGEDHRVGCSPETGFDCSGLIIFVLSQVGISLPTTLRHTSEIFDQFGIFAHSGRDGDLVFFSSKKGLVPKHVGIMINERKYVHSPGKNGSSVKLAELKVTRIISNDPPCVI